MKKSLSQYEPGSAERVVVHAAWQKSRGRNPSMSFVGINNPRKALSFAVTVACLARQTRVIDAIGAVMVRRKSYDDMTDAEIEIAVRNIITTSSSEDEVQRRIHAELDYPWNIDLNTHIPDDATGREARELVRGLGGLVMKNGAMAMAMMQGHKGTIFL